MFFYLYKNISMNKISKISLGLAAMGTVMLFVYLSRRINTNKMLVQISDEGYETAHDILFPDKTRGGGKMWYGPVIPM